MWSLPVSPQGLGSRNGVFLLDGPDAEIEFWDDMRSGQPDPMLIGKEQTQVQAYPGGATCAHALASLDHAAATVAALHRRC